MTPQQAYYKAYDAGKRLPELEHIVLTNSPYAYLYTERLIKDRWIEAEDIIMTHVYYSCCYSLFIIEGKLPEKMHNMMLLHAIKTPSNPYVKHYFEYISK